MSQRSLTLLLLAFLSLPTVHAQSVELLGGSKIGEGPVKPGYAPLFKKVSPAVVSLYALRLERAPFPFAHFGFGPLDQFDVLTRQRISQSIGSGSILTPEGLVVTNSHVIHGAQEIKAITYDRREFELELVLEEPEYDLAVLRIKAPKGEIFPFLKIGDSDKAETGDVVLAIGNPFGLSHTLTQGIISAVGRHHQVVMNPSQSYIQADTVINPGNSGGPLISPEGNILGVCTFIISRTGTSNGIGFAIPANMLKPLVKAAQAGSKEVVRPWLGLEVQPITTDMAKSLGLAQTGGVMITRVQKVSPAAKADLQVGDAILKVDGQPLQDEGALMAKVHASSIDGTLTLEVLTKKGDRRDVKLTLSPPPAIGKGDQYLVTVEGPLKGATLADLSPGAVAKFMLTRGTGVVILDLSPDSSAHAFGLKPGDVIESINGKPVRNLNQAKRFLRNPARSWQLALKRGSQSISLAFSH